MERFENTIFKQCDEIDGKMTEMFELLKELATKEEGGSDGTMMTPGNAKEPIETETEMPVLEVEEINEVKSGAKIIKISENNEAVEAAGSQPVAYYLKHKINEKLIKGLVNNNQFNNSRKEDIEGNFEIPCIIGNLKRMSALVDQGSDVNVMPYSTYMRLTDKKPVETDIRLSISSHSFIYPLGIAEDVLVEITEHIYPVDFMIMDIRENENRPFILGTSFLATAKPSIKFDTGTITLKSGKHKASPGMGKKIKLHLERGMQFNQWRSKNFKGMHSTLIATKEKEMMDNEEEVT
nr:hypothetical protein [Tanacetum cinerariifolium]